jgi:hypothetical protein
MVKNFQAAIRSLVDQDVWTIAAGASPTNGTSGDGAGITGPGSIYIDTANAVAYINTGTLASPTWSELGSAPASITTGDITSDGTVIFSALPTSDPGVAGQLYTSTGAVHVSAG